MKQEKNIWEQSRVELFQKLDCRETGLSQEDAALRLLKYGANELHAGKQKSVWQIFLGQFADFLVLIPVSRKPHTRSRRSAREDSAAARGRR